MSVENVLSMKGLKVKVVEKGGRSLQSILQRSDVAPSMSCPNGCPVCETEGKGMCQVEGVIYKIWCKKCAENGVSTVMYGETGRTAKIRCQEHIDILAGQQSSNLREHRDSKHRGEEDDVKFGCSVVARFPGDALTRQLKEAVLFENHEGISLNDKNEWVRPAFIKVRGERS